MGLLENVNILQGTNSDFHFSHGNTLPLVSLPFSMASWSVQTRGNNGGWFFHPNDRHLQGVRLTHQPSPWIKDYGHFVVMPQCGETYVNDEQRSSSYSISDAVFQPDYLKLNFKRYKADFELSPTQWGAAIRIKYYSEESPRFVFSPFNFMNSISIDAEKRELSGWTKASPSGVPENFALYFSIAFDAEIDLERSGITTLNGNFINITNDIGQGIGASIAFNSLKNGEVNIKVGTSFISIEQARVNLKNDFADHDFEFIRKKATDIWEDALSRIKVKTSNVEHIRTFYSCLYRTLLFPRKFYEFDLNNMKIHYSISDGGINKGVMYTDNGFWDTFRTVYPLFSLLYPEVYAEALEGWVNFYKENGWLPKWPSPGELGIMPGTLIDAVIADAAVKGIVFESLDDAYEGMKKHAEIPSEDDIHGRRGIEYYKKYGYIPFDKQIESVNATLDYSYGDFCISRVAKILRDIDKEDSYRKRAFNYRNIFASETQFMRGKDTAGRMKDEFDAYEWGGDYCEGGAWQSSWGVYHDVAGLAELMGGTDKLSAKIEQMLSEPPLFKVGSYRQEIHEMSEMAAVDFGQCAISNQPCFHVPYIFAMIGKPQLTQYWIRRMLDNLFSSDENGFPGDEDNGSMSAWYIFSALGFYPFCPGVAEYVFGSPIFDAAVLNLPNGREMLIEVKENSRHNVYVSKISINETCCDKVYITHEQFISGGKIEFEMSDKPDCKQYSEDELPFSLSKDQSICN